MSESRWYEVVDEDGFVIARRMTIDVALILVKGMFSEYPNENLILTVKEMERTEGWVSNGN